MVQRAGQRDRAAMDQIVEHRGTRVRARWASGDEVVHLDHFVASRWTLVVSSGMSGWKGMTAAAPGTAVGELTYASSGR